MSDEQRPLPGRARIQDVVIGGVRVNRVLTIDAQASKECAALWATGAFTQLHIGSYENPGLDRIDCLNDFSGITKLHVMLLEHRVDLSPLNKHAATLTEYFCNDELNPLLDARAFTALTSISQIWDAKLDLGDAAALRKLFLDRYAPGDKDLGALPAATHVNELGLLRPGVTSLAKLDRFPALEALRLTMAKSLTSVKDLSGCRGLRELEIDGGKKIQDLHATLSDCRRLERLVLMNVSDLQDVRFVEHMPALRWLNLMGTQVVDGDMTPLIEHPKLEYVVFTSKKHFSHTEAQVRSIRAQRNGGPGPDSGASPR